MATAVESTSPSRKSSAAHAHFLAVVSRRRFACATLFAVERADTRVRDELHQRGFASLQTDAGNVSGDTWLREAAELHSRAERVAKDKYELWTDGQEFRSPVSYAMTFDTESLREVHTGDRMLELARTLAGQPMEPTYSGYLYFEDGDFIGLHTDLPACELTFLAAVAPECPPLVVHPELAGRQPEDLKALSEVTHGSPPGGVALTVAPGSLVALFGGGLPHQTRRIPTGAGSIMATLCYAGQ